MTVAVLAPKGRATGLLAAASAAIQTPSLTAYVSSHPRLHISIALPATVCIMLQYRKTSSRQTTEYSAEARGTAPPVSCELLHTFYPTAKEPKRAQNVIDAHE